MSRSLHRLKHLSPRARLLLVVAIMAGGLASGAVGWMQVTHANGRQIRHTAIAPRLPSGGLPCRSWTLMPSPNVAGANGNVLAGVAVISPTDSWAVGYSLTNTTINEIPTALVEHWNGTAWSLISIPIPTGAWDSALYGIAAASANDIWAVGGYLPSAPPSNGATLIEHFDGTTWSIVPSPNGSFGNTPISNTLQAVTLAGTTVWAVGYLGPQPSQGAPLIEEWSGTTWTLVPAPGNGALNAVSAAPDGTVWAVGDHLAPPDNQFQTLVERWNGTNWDIVPSPDNNGTFQYTNYLLDLTVVSASDIWAVGYYETPTVGEPQIPYFEQWNGSVWTIVPSGSIPAYNNESVLTGIARYSANSSLLLATGSMAINAPHFGQAITLAEQWNGTAWSRMLSPSPTGYWATPRPQAIGSDLAGDVIAVGTTYTQLNTDISQTLVEAYAPSGC